MISLHAWTFLATILFANAEFYNPECSGFGYSCSDCYTQKFCIGSLIVSNTTCGTDNKYCDPRDGQCKSKPHPDCQAETHFKCPRKDGAFPNLQDCKKFIKCTNNTTEDIFCRPEHVYSQNLGKCIVKLENSDCFQPKCGFVPSAQQYPGDPSIYYQCTGGLAKLFACLENTFYNIMTHSCENICKNVSLLPNPRNCSEYISCEARGISLVPVKRSCLPGNGFNPVLGKCQKGLSKLCYEISVFDRDLINLKGVPDVVKDAIKRVTQLLASFDIDVSVLIKYGVPEEIISAILLIGDYMLTHGLRLPPALMDYILGSILPLLSSDASKFVQTILLLILGRK